MRRIYLDHAGTTPVRKEVLDAMQPYFSEKYGNPSSLHSFGRESSKAMEDSRAAIAKLLGVSGNEVYFTSGGTESNNLALKGIAFANKGKGKHIITTAIEHHCIMHAAEWLKQNGYDVTFLPVDKYGLVEPGAVEKAIRKDTILVSVMCANNEIGTIEPINEIGKVCKEKGVCFHTDAVQAFGKIPLDTKNVDVLSASSHKLYGPRGVGLLMARSGVKIEPLLHGGGQERGLRSGTENVAGIVGFAKASELAFKELKAEMPRQQKMRDKLVKGALKIENSYLNGHPEKRLPHNAHFGFKFIEGESLILMLDDKGIAASTGSACSSKSLEPSHVLLAIGLKHEEAHGSLRFTLGRQNTDADVKYVLEVLPEVIKKLRAISPFKKDYEFSPTEGFEHKHEEEHAEKGGAEHE
jgi:cysteine desulfurase